MLKRFQNWFRFYINIPTFLIYLLIFALFWHPIGGAIFGIADYFVAEFSPPPWMTQLVLSVVSDILAGLVLGITLLIFLRKRNLHILCGRFNAYLTTQGLNEPWGNVTLTYELLESNSDGPRIRIQIQNENIILKGEAIVFREQYLTGYYREVSKLARRRAGTFFLELDGEGNYSGKFLYLDPDTRTPSTGTVKWVRDE